jgi:hypothetical protein
MSHLKFVALSFLAALTFGPVNAAKAVPLNNTHSALELSDVAGGLVIKTQTLGMERRHVRRMARHDRRMERRMHRHERRMHRHARRMERRY